jgi:hypothetical protein
MIIANIVGGLGNQLFQYAMARRLALNRGAELLLDSSGYRPLSQTSAASAVGHRRLLLFNFRISAREATDAEKSLLRDRYIASKFNHRIVRLVRRYWRGLFWPASHIVEQGYRFQPDALTLPDNVYLSGFWQSEKYFADVTPQIRQDLVLVDETIRISARHKVGTLKQQFGTVVSLHVRRGDLAYAYETLNEKHRVHGPPMTVDYFQRAILEFPSSCCFLVFSDTPGDVEWCRQRIRAKNIEFSDARSELWDFAAMQACDHHIISNSTFSWWAAWLNSTPGKRVIAPRQWSGADSKVEMHTNDLIPANWTTL